MADTGTMEIEGKKMKLCPGWQGNNYRCGRGSPRLIQESAEVCENCSRGMRKRGQKTREEQEEAIRRRRAAIAKLERGLAKVRATVDLADVMPLDPEVAAKATLVSVIEALEGLTRGDLDPPDEWGERYYHREKVYAEDRWQILRLLAGLPAKDDDE